MTKASVPLHHPRVPSGLSLVFRVQAQQSEAQNVACSPSPLRVFASSLGACQPPRKPQRKNVPFLLGKPDLPMGPSGQSHQLYHHPTSVSFRVCNESVLIQSSINNVLELCFGLFVPFFFFLTILPPEGTLRPACPSVEPQPLKELIFRGVRFTFTKERSIPKLNVSFYLS